MKITLFALTFSILTLSLSCGSDKNSDYAPLSGGQKAQFATFMVDAGRPISAASAAAVAQWRDSNSSSEEPKKPDAAQLAMTAFLKQAHCETKWEPGTGADVVGAKPTHLQMGGATCPIALAVDISVNSVPNQSIESSYAINYEVRNDEYKSLNDVTSLKMNGAISARLSNQSEVSGGGSITGEVQSTKYGTVVSEISFAASGNSQGLMESLVFVLHFQDFVAELKLVLTSDGKTLNTQHMLNGETISEAEFKSYTQSFLGSVSGK